MISHHGGEAMAADIVRCDITSVRKQREAKVKAQLALSFLFGLEPQSVAAHSWHRWVGGSFPLS